MNFIFMFLVRQVADTYNLYTFDDSVKQIVKGLAKKVEKVDSCY